MLHRLYPLETTDALSTEVLEEDGLAVIVAKAPVTTCFTPESIISLSAGADRATGFAVDSRITATFFSLTLK